LRLTLDTELRGSRLGRHRFAVRGDDGADRVAEGHRRAVGHLELGPPVRANGSAGDLAPRPRHLPNARLPGFDACRESGDAPLGARMPGTPQNFVSRPHWSMMKVTGSHSGAFGSTSLLCSLSLHIFFNRFISGSEYAR
jgi:hypothetical protein